MVTLDQTELPDFDAVKAAVLSLWLRDIVGITVMRQKKGLLKNASLCGSVL